MTSSTPHAAPPSAPVVRMRDPGELLAALPFLIGFHPRDSLLVLAFGGASGRRITLTQRVDLPEPEHAPAICAALAANIAHGRPAAAAVLVVGGAEERSAGPPRGELAAVATLAIEETGVPVRMRAWAASTAAGAEWACYDHCGCRGVLPDPETTPVAATAVAAGVLVQADRTGLEQLVAPVAADVLRRRERLLARAVDIACGDALCGDGGGAAGTDGPPLVAGDTAAAVAVVEAALADTAAGTLRLDDGRVLALALALSDPLARDAALVRCAAPDRAVPGCDGPEREGPECDQPGRDGSGLLWAEQLWAALARETPDPEAAEPAALLAACALLRGDGALAGIALDRAERAWPGHRLTALLRAAWQAGMRPEEVRECLRTAPVAPAARARRRRKGRRR